MIPISRGPLANAPVTPEFLGLYRSSKYNDRREIRMKGLQAIYNRPYAQGSIKADPNEGTESRNTSQFAQEAA